MTQTPAMSGSVPASWARIDAWLAEHAPSTHADLAPPAVEEEIADVARHLALPMPDSLWESLLIHNGSAGGGAELFPPFLRLSGTEEIKEEWDYRTDLLETVCADEDPEYDATTDACSCWDRHWIPFASSGSGDQLVIDASPVSAGRWRIGHTSFSLGSWFERHPMYSSLPALLESVATALETGADLHQYRPLVTEEQRLSWKTLPQAPPGRRAAANTA